MKTLLLALIGKRVKDDEDSGINKRLLFYNHLPDLIVNNTNFKVNLMKNLLINSYDRTLNTNKQSLTLAFSYDKP